MKGLPPHHQEGGQALLDGCCHIRLDENVGRPLLETGHPVDAGKRDEGIHSGLHCENISSDTKLKSDYCTPVRPKSGVQFHSYGAGPLDSGVGMYSTMDQKGLLQYLSILVLYSETTFFHHRLCATEGLNHKTRGFSNDVNSRTVQIILYDWRIFAVKTRIFPKAALIFIFKLINQSLKRKNPDTANWIR